MNMDDSMSCKSDGSDASVTRVSGLTGTVSFIKPGTITQTGLFGTVRVYKEGDYIHGGFFSETKLVTADANRSPYVTPTSSPDDPSTAGDLPPKMALA